MHRSAIEMRQSRRSSVRMATRLRIRGGYVYDLTASNLSTHGCGVSGAHIKLCPDQRVSVKFGSLEYLPAVVRWSRQKTAGIELLQPLYGPVMEHLAREFPRKV